MSRDIFKLDETGLIYHASRNNTFHVKDEEAAGGKQSKERLTVMLCVSMTSEKMMTLVISKSAISHIVSRMLK